MKSPVLEPDFDLAFAEVEKRGHFDATRTTQISIEVELFLQFHQLGGSVSRPRPLRWLLEFCREMGREGGVRERRRGGGERTRGGGERG